MIGPNSLSDPAAGYGSAGRRVLNEPATSGRLQPLPEHRSWATLRHHKPDLVCTMPISVSTDPIRPAERQAFWTEAICRSFANVETRPLGSAIVSGHFEFVEIGDAKLVRFDSSPQCYTRDARLVSRAGSDEFMFDFQRRGRSAMVQAGNEGTIDPGYGVLYDARRPFEDRLVRSRTARRSADRNRPRRVAVATPFPRRSDCVQNPSPCPGRSRARLRRWCATSISMPNAPAQAGRA